LIAVGPPTLNGDPGGWGKKPVVGLFVAGSPRQMPLYPEGGLRRRWPPGSLFGNPTFVHVLTRHVLRPVAVIHESVSFRYQPLLPEGLCFLSSGTPAYLFCFFPPGILDLAGVPLLGDFSALRWSGFGTAVFFEAVFQVLSRRVSRGSRTLYTLAPVFPLMF